jgi:hypothetical protein
MPWRTIGSNRYYQQAYRDGDGRVRSRYIGRGPAAEAMARLDAYARERRREAREATREVAERARRMGEEARDRLSSLGSIVDRAMVAGGYYRHRGTWRRRGVITMGSIKDREAETQRAIEREAARRHFAALEGDKLAAEVDRLNVEMSAVALDSLIELLTSDPYRQEAFRRKVERVAEELAGDDPTPLVRLLARGVAILQVEKYAADTRFYKLTELGGPAQAAVLGWRALVDRQLNAKIRTLAQVRDVEASAIEKTAGRLRLVG